MPQTPLFRLRNPWLYPYLATGARVLSRPGILHNAREYSNAKILIEEIATHRPR